MLETIKENIKHTAIYGLGNIATKLIGVVLLPLYTKHITVSEYGILSILEISITIISAVLIFGQAQSYLRFYNLQKFKHKQKSTLFSITIFLLFIGLIFIIIGQFCASYLASFFFDPPKFTIYFRLCCFIIFLAILNNLFLFVLRAQEKSTFYVVITVLKLAIMLSLNIYFVAFLKVGINGILYSYLIGEAIAFIILLPIMILAMVPKFETNVLISSLQFGLPLVFTSLAGMVLNLGDRYVLKLLVNYEAVGLYNLGYKVAGILNMFLIQSFSTSFLPLAYKIHGQKDDRRFYSKILTYFVFILSWTGLGLALFGKEAVKFFARNSDYWSAYIVIPIIILSYIFSGAKSVVWIGILLKNKTKILAYTTIFSAFLNIGLNFILIPKYGMLGAAIATLISFVVLYFMTYISAQRLFPISYDNLRLLKIFLLGIGLYFISTLTTNFNFSLGILFKIFLLIIFPFILYFVKFYEEIEIITIKKMLNKLKENIIIRRILH
ncbi:MAG: lipopolysaccharide biosynthesis protein [Candidatus Hodarchaeota archaeon]